jgi:hypothetical protein
MFRPFFAAAAILVLSAPVFAQDAPAPKPASELQALTCAQLMAKYEEVRTSFSEEKETEVMADFAAAQAAQKANNETECKARLIKILSLP